MAAAEHAVDRGIDTAQPANHFELLPVEPLAPVIELHPRLDPMSLTREDFLTLPDGKARRDVLISLKRDPYNFARTEQAERLFPEGFDTPLTEIELKVFAAMGRIMSAEDGVVVDQDTTTLQAFLHDIAVEQAISALQAEGAHRREGHFWATRNEIGGYKLNRQIAFETERQAKIENTLDEVKMHILEDMAMQLARRDIQMRDSDREEMEKLREDYEERERTKEAYWKAQRQKGYEKLKVH